MTVSISPSNLLVNIGSLRGQQALQKADKFRFPSFPRYFPKSRKCRRTRQNLRVNGDTRHRTRKLRGQCNFYWHSTCGSLNSCCAGMAVFCKLVEGLPKNEKWSDRMAAIALSKNMRDLPVGCKIVRCDRTNRI